MTVRCLPFRAYPMLPRQRKKQPAECGHNLSMRERG